MSGSFEFNTDFDISLSPHFNLLWRQAYVKVLRDENGMPKNIDLLPEDIQKSYKKFLYSLGMRELHSKNRVRINVVQKLLVFEHYGCIELTPVVGKIMRLKHDGRDIPEDLYEAWKYICESKSIRRVWDEPDEYLFLISDAIEGLERLGYITIEYMEEF